eukprot:7581763-Ditylum_brightwellii.AAC.1
MSPNARMTRGQKQVYEKGEKPPTPLRQRPMEEEKRRSLRGIVATNKKGAQKVLKGQETRMRTRNVSEKCVICQKKNKNMR